jgi:DNA polymerase-3 subunit epsilon
MLKLKTDRPLAVFDIESTGTNPRYDRIVDLAIVTIPPHGARATHTWRFNPERPIPAEATRVHGITDADVAPCPVFKDKAGEIAAVLDGCDLAGYNAARYDIPMLYEEFLRAGLLFSLEGRRVIDAQRIFHQREPRDLKAALAFYCSELHLGAHGALEDVQATIRVLEGQFERYHDLPRDIDALHAYCNPRRPDTVDQAGKLKWINGEAAINFGKKYPGRSLRDLVNADPDFLKWMLKGDFPRETQEIIRNAMNGKFPTPPPPAEE